MLLFPYQAAADANAKPPTGARFELQGTAPRKAGDGGVCGRTLALLPSQTAPQVWWAAEYFN